MMQPNTLISEHIRASKDDGGLKPIQRGVTIASLDPLIDPE